MIGPGGPAARQALTACPPIRQLVNALVPRVRRSPDGYKPGLASAFLFTIFFAITAAAAPPLIGQRAPEVELPALRNADSPIVSLSALEGKVIYLDFWASWCGPCRISFPLLEELRQELRASGFEVLAINLDEFQQDAEEFLASYPVSYPVLRDAAGDTPRRYGILGMPTGFLVDREGVIRYVHQGFRRGDIDDLRKHVVQLLEAR